MAKRKEWSEMSRKEKVVGVIGLIIIIVIVGSVLNGSSQTANQAKNSLGASSSSNNSNGNISIDSGGTQAEAAPEPVMPKVYTGNGDDVVKITKPVDGAFILSFSCPGCTDNTVVNTNGADSLIVNTIGPYSGSHIIDVADGSNTTKVTITASSAWKLTLSGLDKAVQVSNKEVAGQGDSVLHMTLDTTQATITNDGSENFVVNVYPSGGGYGDLPVNTIGSYKGTVPLAGPSYVQVTSDGAWTISPSY